MHPLHFHKPYLAHFLTNSSDFYDITCAKKRATKSFQCSKTIDYCRENYKTLFTKVFHILVYITIVKLQYVLVWTKTPKFISHILYPKKIPLNHIKTTFSLLVATLYFMSSMQWNIYFCSLNNYSKKESSQRSFIFYRLFL